MKRFKLFIYAFHLFVVFSGPLMAQPFMAKEIPRDRAVLNFRYIHPNLDDKYTLGAASGIYDFNFSAPINSKWGIELSLPYVYYDVSYRAQWDYSYEFSEKKGAIGDLYVGFQRVDTISAAKLKAMSFGAYFPTSPSSGFYSVNFFGTLANYYEAQKYLYKNLTLYSNFAFRWKYFEAYTVGVDFGPQYMITTDTQYDDQNDFAVHFAASAWAAISDFKFGAEFSGLLLLTGDADEFGDRFFNFLSFGAQWTKYQLQPGIFYQLNFHRIFDYYSSGSLGLKLNFLF